MKISRYCEGERCRICTQQAEHKISEVIFDDDPQFIRHEFTAYVCHNHFVMIMGPAATGVES